MTNLEKIITIAKTIGFFLSAVLVGALIVLGLVFIFNLAVDTEPSGCRRVCVCEVSE